MSGVSQPSRVTRRRWLVVAARGVAVAITCNIARAADPPLVSGSEVLVDIDNFTFTPAFIKVQSGTRVTWTNRDDIPHVVLVRQLKLRSNVMDTGQSFSHAFAEAGSFDYFCALHPHMTGQVVVMP
jgi:plastocyanin